MKSNIKFCVAPLALTICLWFPTVGGLVLLNSTAACDEKSLKIMRDLQRKGDVTNLIGNPCVPPIQAKCSKRLTPTLFLIGYEHSGSTSFAEALNMHPQLSYGRMKEHRYFCKDAAEDTKSWTQYLDEFNVPCETRRTFDATPFYYQMGSSASTRCGHFHEHGIGAVRAFKESVGSEAQLIVLIRDPIDWYCSQGGGRNCLGYLGPDPGTPNPFGYIGTKNPAHLVPEVGSCFADHLEPWLNVFHRRDMLFIQSEDFFADQEATLRRAFDFVGVSGYTVAPVRSGRRRSSVRPAITLEDRKVFHALPSQLNCRHRLESLTGLRLAWRGS